MTESTEKSWKDRVPPDGHLPPSYEVQVCDEGNKVIAVQMLNKAQLNYKIAVRQGQFYIATDDMETFTQVKSVLNQTIDGAKEAAHTGVPVEVTPVGSNVTPPMPVTEGFGDVWAVYIPANIYDGKYYDFRTYRTIIRDSSVKTEAQAVAWAHEHKDEIMQKADRARSGGKRYVKAPIEKNLFFTGRDGKPGDFHARLIKAAVDDKDKQPVTEATFSRKHRREVDCLEIMKNSSFIKKLDLKDGQLQTMRDELEGAWDAGYETGWDDNA